MKRVLVTGGTGFIGKWTLAPLLARGFEVHVVGTNPPVLLLDAITFHHCNLLDSTTHIQLMQKVKPTHLLHAAWYAEHGKFWNAVENISWLTASISLATAFYAHGGHRLLGVGTCAEYSWNDNQCEEGVTAEIPVTFYGKIKKSTFDCLQKIAETHQQSFAWARIFSPYGEFETKARLIPYIISQLLQGDTAACTHGNQTRDFMHVSDIGEALAELLDSDLAGSINIASGVPVKIKDVVQQIAAQLAGENLVKFDEMTASAYSPSYIVASVNRLNHELKWMPKLSLEQGLLRTIAWWRQALKID